MIETFEKFKLARERTVKSEKRRRAANAAGDKQREALLARLVRLDHGQAKIAEYRAQRQARINKGEVGEADKSEGKEIQLMELRYPIEVAHVERQLQELSDKQKEATPTPAAAEGRLTAMPSKSPKGARPPAPMVTGGKVTTNPTNVEPQKFQSIVKSVSGLFSRVKKSGASFGKGKVSQKLFSYKSGTSTFSFTVLTNQGKAVGVSGSLMTEGGTKTFATKRGL